MSPSRNSGRRRSKNQFTTKSGNTFKIHRNITEKWVARKDAAQRRRAERKANLPKSRLKRFLYHFQPIRMYHYWFSRDGAIMALKILGIGFVIGFVVLLALFAYFRKDLSSITDVSGSNIGGSIRYYDRTGQTLLWQDYDAVKRIPVKTPDIAQNIRNATVAVEDKDFYKHGGFDVRGIVRAGFNDALGKGATQGGSTITEQLVKLTQNWGQQRTITRKVKELILAVELEREYSKSDILTYYLNTAPYGNIEYGVEAASRDYFQKSAKDLTLDEAAFLAAIPKSPAVYSPYGPYYDKKDLVNRQQYILDLMVAQGYISKNDAEAAKKVDIIAKIHKPETKFAGIKAPYFALSAKSELEKKYGATIVNRGGWKVTTTVDMNLQAIAEKVVQSNLPNAHSHGADEEAIAAEDVKTGQMIALVGGTDFNNPDHGKINYAQWNISPGSSFKPYDYSTLIDKGTNVGAGSVLYDAQVALPGYPCTVKGLPPPKGKGNCLEDYDFRYPGPLTLRYALGGSRNVPAVKAMLIPGTNNVIKTADSMMDVSGGYKCYNPGVDVNIATAADEAQCYGASAIGDGAYLHLDNHVNGLATLARMGQAIPATYILKIEDAGGKPLYTWKQPTGTQVIRQDSAYIVDDMASDPNASYLPTGYYKWHRYNGWHTAVKTGTTNNGFDGLMMAWNTQYAVGSWVGDHTRNKALSGFMEVLTTPLTRGFMTAALDDLHTQPVIWTKPADIKTAPAFVVRGHVGVGSIEPSPSTDIFPSWYQGNTNQQNANKPVDIVSNKLATDCTPSLARKTDGNSNSNAFSVDIFVNGGGGSGNQTDDVHLCTDARPSVDNVTFNGNAGAGDCSSPCTIVASISAGTHPLTDPKYAAVPGSGSVNLLVDNSVVKTVQAGTSATFNYSTTGTHQVSVKVIDSVLYDASSNPVSINFGNSGSNSFTVSKTGTLLTWDSVNGATSYKVYWSGPGAGSSPATTSNTTYNLPSGSDHDIRVEAYNGANLIGTSNSL